MDRFKINGLNSGRNSYKAISKSIIKKSTSKMISSIRTLTIKKILFYTFYSSIPSIIYDGIDDAFDVFEFVKD